MNILITGLAGFVGSSLARSILQTEPDIAIYGLDNFSFGYRERLSDIEGRLEFKDCDVFDIADAFPGVHFDLIVHCAAIAPLPECQISSARALQQNVGACGAVADFALRSGVRDIVFFSSGAIYEGVETFPTPENIAVRPRLVYPTTKFLAEQYFEAMTRSHGLNVTSLRLFNLYGPHQDYFRKQPPLIGYLLKTLLTRQQAVLFSSGEQCRDYVYIDDLTRLVMMVGRKMRSLSEGGTYDAINVGNGEPVSVNAILRTLEELAGLTLDVERREPTRYWDNYPQLNAQAIPLRPECIDAEVRKHTHADITAARLRYGWEAATQIRVGLTACLERARLLFGDN
jgi:nucleoside-diphosphate-sugar epimerase